MRYGCPTNGRLRNVASNSVCSRRRAAAAETQTLDDDLTANEMPRIRWSKLKGSLDALRAPKLRKRVALYQARYRYTREEIGRIWVTVDGREVASFDTSTYIRRRAELGADLFEIRRAETPDQPPDHAAYLETDDRAREILRRAGQYDDYQAIVDLEASLSLPIDDALTSPSPLVRALAVIDRRVGKRRLRTLQVGSLEHALVRQLYLLRCEAEGVDIQPRGAV
jgi:hypothetical protein